MAEQYTVQATVMKVGTLEPFTASNGKVWDKFSLEIKVGDELKTIDSLGFHWKNVKVGGIYDLDLLPQDNPDYNHSLRGVRQLGTDTEVTQTASAPIPTEPKAAANAPTAQPSLKPDFALRFREWNMHSRNAKIQARERSADYIKLALEGKLLNDDGEAVTGLRLSTIRGWHKEEYALYFEELNEYNPHDAFGAFKESDNAQS